jgi:hypothetical protein
MKRIVICGLLAAALFGSVSPALAAPTPVIRLTHIEQLQSQLRPESRLYVVGNPQDVGEYRKIVEANSNLVVVVIEKSNDAEAQVQAVMNVLNNFDVVRTQMVNRFLQNPEAYLAVRIDQNTAKTNRDGNHPGFTGVTVTEAQRLAGLGDAEFWAIYQGKRSSGLSVPRAIAGATDEGRTRVQAFEQGKRDGLAGGVEEVFRNMAALRDRIEQTGYRPEGFSPDQITVWSTKLNGASQSTSTLVQVAKAESVVDQVAQEITATSKRLDRFIETEVAVKDVRNGIALLKQAIGSARYEPSGFSDTKVDQWYESLDSAMKLLRNGDLALAQNTVNAVDSEVAGMMEEIQSVLSTRAAYRSLAIAALLLSVIGIIVSTVLTRHVKKEAERLADDIRGEVGNITSQAMYLADKSTFVAINANGLQADKANQLNALNCALLEQTTVLNKYLQECDKVLDPRGLAALFYMLTPFGVMYVKAISTGKKALTLSADDVQKLVATKGENLERFVTQLHFASAQKSVVEVRATYTNTFRQAQELYLLLAEAEDALTKEIVEVETLLAGVKTTLEQIGSSAFFSSDPYRVGVVGPIANTEGGLLALARSKQLESDYLGGIEHGTKPAFRILTDGMEALRLTELGGASLVPQGNSAVAALGADGSELETDWIFVEIARLSDSLDEIVQSNSFSGSIALQIAEHRQKLEQAIQKLKDAERLNQLRVDVWPSDLEACKGRVAVSETSVLADLQRLGFFAGGEVSGIYVEQDNSPKDLITQFVSALQQLVELLGSGQVAQSLAIEASIAAWKERIDELVAKTEHRLATYSAAAAQIVSDIEIGETRCEDLSNSEVTDCCFSTHSQGRAMTEAGASSATLFEGLNTARQLIVASRGGRQDADSLMHRAAVLEAGNVLDRAQESVDEANSLLLAIPEALERLGDAVMLAQSEIQVAREQVQASFVRANELGVRQVTRRAVAQVVDDLKRFDTIYQSQPYEVLEAISNVSEKALKLQGEILSDITTYAQILNIIAQANGTEKTATDAIRSAEARHFAHATVDTTSSRAALSSFQKSIAAALTSLSQEDYVSAEREASAALGYVTSVDNLASTAVREAETEHQDEVDRIARDSIAYHSSSDNSSDTGWSGDGDDSSNVSWSGDDD